MRISLEIRKAKRNDLVIGHRLRTGQTYYLLSKESNEFEGPYIINDGSDVYQFATWLKQEMIFVNNGIIDNKIIKVSQNAS